MYKYIIQSILLSSMLYAGGKNLIPATQPVIPVSVIEPNPLYVGVGFLWSGMQRDCECIGGKAAEDTYGVMLRAGYDFNPYIGAEIRGLYSSIKKDIATTSHYGIFLKPMYPVTESLNIYGLLGYAHTKIDCVVSKMSYKNDGFSWGVGLEYDFSNDDQQKQGIYDREFDGYADQEYGWGAWFDYQNLLHNSGTNNIKSNIVTVGITYDF